MNDFESTFEWMESPSVVIKSVDAIAVYSNAPGDIVIRQKSSKGVFREEDSVVVVPRDRLDAIIAALEQEKARARKPAASVVLDEPINQQRKA